LEIVKDNELLAGTVGVSRHYLGKYLVIYVATNPIRFFVSITRVGNRTLCNFCLSVVATLN
jgi:hypothetical protein